MHLFLGSTVTAQTSGTLFNIDDSDFQWNGNDAYDWAGEGLAHLGDWNGDGNVDFAIGATGDESNGAGSGTIYVIQSTGSAPPSGGAASVVAASSLSIEGNGGWYIGANIDGMGDFDGDGNDDLGVGVIQANANGTLSGSAFLFNGGQTGTLAIEDADLRLNGTGANDRAGAGIGQAGDTDGDGYPDMLVGVSRDDSGGADAGAIVLILGRSDLTSIDGADIQSVADATVTGPSAGIGIGEAFVGNFDFDGDGELDLLAGAPRDGLNQEGAGYLMLGPISGTRSLATDAYASFVGDDPLKLITVERLKGALIQADDRILQAEARGEGVNARLGNDVEGWHGNPRSQGHFLDDILCAASEGVRGLFRHQAPPEGQGHAGAPGPQAKGLDGAADKNDHQNPTANDDPKAWGQRGEGQLALGGNGNGDAHGGIGEDDKGQHGAEKEHH